MRDFQLAYEGLMDSAVISFERVRRRMREAAHDKQVL